MRSFIFFFLLLTNYSFAVEVGQIYFLRDNKIVVKLSSKYLEISKDKNIFQNKRYIVVDDLKVSIGELRFVRLSKNLGLFVKVRGDFEKGQLVYTAKMNKKSEKKQATYANSPYLLSYQFSSGQIKSSDPESDSNITAHSLWLRYLFDPHFTFSIGLKSTASLSSFDSEDSVNNDDLAPVAKAMWTFDDKADLSSYIVSHLDSYLVTQPSELSGTEQSFLYKLSIGGGVLKRVFDDFGFSADASYVLPMKSEVNSLKSGYEFGLGGFYWISNYQISYRGEYLLLSKEFGTDKMMTHYLSLGVSF